MPGHSWAAALGSPHPHQRAPRGRGSSGQPSPRAGGEEQQQHQQQPGHREVRHCTIAQRDGGEGERRKNTEEKLWWSGGEFSLIFVCKIQISRGNEICSGHHQAWRNLESWVVYTDLHIFPIHSPKSNPNVSDITRNVDENEILHEIFRVVQYLFFPATFHAISRKFNTFGTVYITSKHMKIRCIYWFKIQNLH